MNSRGAAAVGYSSNVLLERWHKAELVQLVDKDRPIKIKDLRLLLSEHYIIVLL